ncbi:hypothetical protein BGX26_006987 [Mortierella sp. AD094]|nr:hypothetical protein BGX26_006987 [Mortierella sp. AD094]
MLSSAQVASSAPSLHIDVPVLISGAGPSGVFAALLLTKLNIPCRLIERHLDISPLSKALVIHARTMEIFAISGILDKFLTQGQQISEFHAYNGAKKTGVLQALTNRESHYNFGLFLEQFQTTAILTEEYESLGQKIDRGWELMDTKVVEDESGKSWVETKIRRAIVGTNIRQTESTILGVVEEDPDEEGKIYEVQIVRSEYLIATDGGKSVVRHKLNIGFPGRTLDNSIIIYDGHVESDIPFNDITVVNGVNDRIMGVFPLHDGNVRIILDQGIITPEEHAALRSEDLTMEKFEELASACITPAKFKCLDCSWLTYYRVNERQAEHFAYKNRVFLAGDASHVHSPAGGQGMNAGLQDSFNLTWKLALVLHGIAPNSILETYESERKPVAEGIIKLSARLLEAGLAQDFVGRTIRKIVLTIAPYILPYVAPRASQVTMLTIGYKDNSINQISKSQASVGDEFQVGHRARDGDLRAIQKQDMGLAVVEGASIRLHELMTGPGIFHVVVFTSDMLLSPTASETKSVKGVETTTSEELAKNTELCLDTWRSKWAYKSAQQIASSALLPGPVSAIIPGNIEARELFMVHVIASNLSVPSLKGECNSSSTEFGTDILAIKNAGEGKVYLDHSGVLHQKYGVAAKHGPGAIVVVRPDSHYGFRVLGANKTAWEEVNQYFESILTK